MPTPSAIERRRELSYLIGRFVTDHLIRTHRLFDGDLTAAVVLATIAQRNVQRFYDEVARNSPKGLDRLVAAGEHLPHLRHCNALSVSSATGIPRETVRRKVRWLEQKGWITVGERGQLEMSRTVADHFAAFDAAMIDRFETCARQVVGILDGKTAAD
jgi:predicted transcriptional regulator